MSHEIDTALEALVHAGELAGAATLGWRDGVLVHRGAVGFRSVSEKEPLAPDDLFRIASMSKPITSTLALMLYEEGVSSWTIRSREWRQSSPRCAC